MKGWFRNDVVLTSQNRWLYSINHKDIGTYTIRNMCDSRIFNVPEEIFYLRDQLYKADIRSLVKEDIDLTKITFIKDGHFILNEFDPHPDVLYNYKSLFTSNNKFVIINKESCYLHDYFHLNKETYLAAYYLSLLFYIVSFNLKASLSSTLFSQLELYLEFCLNKLFFLTKRSPYYFCALLMKELFVSLLSFLVSPNDPYYYGSNKNSVIKEFMNSFLLLNPYKLIYESEDQETNPFHLFSYDTIVLSNKVTILISILVNNVKTCIPITLDKDNDVTASLLWN